MAELATIEHNHVLEHTQLGGTVRLYRVLSIVPERRLIAVINLTNRRAFPEWWEFTQVETDLGLGTLRVVDDPAPPDLRPDSLLTPANVAKRDRRWKVIEPLVRPAAEVGGALDIFEPALRSALVWDAHYATGTARDVIFDWLRMYWRGGQSPNALLTKYSNCGAPGRAKAVRKSKRGRRAEGLDQNPELVGINVTKEVRRLLVKGGKRFFRKRVQGRSLTLREAFQRTLEVYFQVGVRWEDGVLVPILPSLTELPTLRQFGYWNAKARKEERKEEQEAAERFGARQFALRHRPVLGSSEHLSNGPGDLFLIDATVVDLYLLSELDPRFVIGRPVLYLVIDHWSRMIVGYYVGFEGPSWMGAMMALENVFTDKVTHCARYGISIDQAEWPCAHVPNAIMADRGELVGKKSDRIPTGLPIRLINNPAYRADFKSFVEGQFLTTNERGIKRQPGAVNKDWHRGDPDYRLNATLTLYFFHQLIIELILHNNLARRLEGVVPQGFPLPPDMDPRPLDLWDWGVENHLFKGRQFERQRVRAALLEPTRARTTHNGLSIHNGLLYYDCKIGHEEGWFLRGTGRGSQLMELRIDRRDISTAFLMHDSGKRIIECPLTHACARYRGLALEEVWDERQRRTTARKLDRRERHQSIARVNARMDAITDEARRHKEAALGGPGIQPNVQHMTEIKQVEREVVRSNEAFTRMDPPPPPVAPSAGDDWYVPLPD